MCASMAATCVLKVSLKVPGMSTRLYTSRTTQSTTTKGKAKAVAVSEVSVNNHSFMFDRVARALLLNVHVGLHAG